MEPKAGELYRHFKGRHYRVVSVARHSENWDQKLVIYRSVDGADEVAARPLEMWAEEIGYNEYRGPRFIKIKNMKESNKLQSVLFELTLIFLVLSNFAIFQAAEIGSYGHVFKTISIVLLALLILHFGFRLTRK